MTMKLFREEINGWASWGKIFQSIEAFELLIKHILGELCLPFSPIERCVPGTNAVFKSGGYVIKIFAPRESGINTESDYKTELFGLGRANRLGIPAPGLIASGSVRDRYLFYYMVMENIGGTEFGAAEAAFSDADKAEIGRKMRRIIDTMNTECENFNGIDVINGPERQKRWNSFDDRFKKERNDYIRHHDFGKPVFVHGDLNPDNVLVRPGPSGYDIFILDFADAAAAPREYELAALICEMFCFEKPYMRGFFGNFDARELTERCFDGLIIHDFGAGIIQTNLGEYNEITCLRILKDRLYTAILSGKPCKSER